jgi:hypothetical protein
MVAHICTSGYALVATDPIGAPGTESRVLDEFLDLLSRASLARGLSRNRESDTPLSPNADSARWTPAMTRLSSVTGSPSAAAR